MQENNNNNNNAQTEKKDNGQRKNRPFRGKKDHFYNKRKQREEHKESDAQPKQAPDVCEEEKAEPVAKPEIIDGPTVEIVGVNFREAGKIYYFAPESFTLTVGQKVIVETSRGVEIGTVKVANSRVPESVIIPPLKGITRPATEEDLVRDGENRKAEMDAALICKRKIKSHGLEMSLVAVEYTFDRSKLIFYFTCESRVDFRELVKDLASTFHTRIELRQIGIRDEAKIMGGLGICGRKFCCAGFLTDFVQVSIKMAKEQNFSLNSSKVSGACGRLMCCLRYEHETYEDAIKRTPPTGSVVSTSDGEGVVIETKPLAAEIKVRFENNDKESVKLFKVKDVKVLRTPHKKHQNNDEDEEISKN